MATRKTTTQTVVQVETVTPEQIAEAEERRDAIAEAGIEAESAYLEFAAERKDRDYGDLSPADEFVQSGADQIQERRLASRLGAIVGHDGATGDTRRGRLGVAQRKLAELRQRQDGRYAAAVADLLRSRLTAIGADLGTVTVRPLGPVSFPPELGAMFTGTASITVTGSPLSPTMVGAALREALSTATAPRPDGTAGPVPLVETSPGVFEANGLSFEDGDLKAELDAKRKRQDGFIRALQMGAVVDFRDKDGHGTQTSGIPFGVTR